MTIANIEISNINVPGNPAFSPIKFFSFKPHISEIPLYFLLNKEHSPLACSQHSSQLFRLVMMNSTFGFETQVKTLYGRETLKREKETKGGPKRKFPHRMHIIKTAFQEGRRPRRDPGGARPEHGTLSAAVAGARFRWFSRRIPEHATHHAFHLKIDTHTRSMRVIM